MQTSVLTNCVIFSGMLTTNFQLPLLFIAARGVMYSVRDRHKSIVFPACRRDRSADSAEVSALRDWKIVHKTRMIGEDE